MDATDLSGITALHWAALNGNLDSIKVKVCGCI